MVLTLLVYIDVVHEDKSAGCGARLDCGDGIVWEDKFEEAAYCIYGNNKAEVEDWCKQCKKNGVQKQKC
eukprot:2998995-Ditylum_brightwellii.AAC.1